MTAPKLVTRKPTGKPSWPLLLMAGAEKCGKSYAAAAFSSSDLVDRTFWIEIGEGAADQYGALPGARYEIVEHEGTFPSILAACQAAVAEPRRNGKPNAIVVDSMTELWDLLGNEQQTIASNRNKATITIDQWNAAKKKWRQIVDALRVHDGPVILTARLEQVTVMDDRGKPTAEKEWKVRAEKNLPFEVDGIVKMYRPREAFLSGMRTLTLPIKPGEELPFPNEWDLDWFLRRLGIEGNSSPRAYTAPAIDQEYVARADTPTTEDALPIGDER